MHIRETSTNWIAKNPKVFIYQTFSPTMISLRTFLCIGRLHSWQRCWNLHANSRTIFAQKLDFKYEIIGFSIGNFFFEYILRASRLVFWHTWLKLFGIFCFLNADLKFPGRLVLLNPFPSARETQFWQNCQKLFIKSPKIDKIQIFFPKFASSQYNFFSLTMISLSASVFPHR